ncbi:MAG TPA: hypothetical protein VD995_29685 [Azospirillum sp.]|nr:hypothetical protein [Azospirillum sp.]
MTRFAFGLMVGLVLGGPVAGFAAWMRESNSPMFGTIHVLELAPGEQGAVSCRDSTLSGPHLATANGATYVCTKK